jgi:hypothetical protein
MSQCPYPEVIVDPVTDAKEFNIQYILWHEGYEAHKLEVMSKVKYIDRYMSELCAEVRKIKELKKRLEKQES